MRIYDEYDGIYVNYQGDYESDKLGAVMYDILFTRKKISRPLFELMDIQYLIELSNRINSNDEFQFQMDDFLFEQIEFPKVLGFLIRPKKISIVSDRRARDLCKHPSLTDDKGIYDPARVRDITERIYSSQKSAGSYVKVSELREAKLLNDVNWMVFNSMGDDWSMNLNDDNFVWPIPVADDILNLYGENYCNEDADYCMHQFIIRWGLIAD
jgi:hypothetical protein